MYKTVTKWRQGHAHSRRREGGRVGMKDRWIGMENGWKENEDG